ncbi:Pyridoxamine 5'-phosphate oxidase [Salinimicrobium catena]|uniref:Pyridoxine/pyridoxamine 5'-phosphate oxidase n=1 Tax=Salinimicrobium catena TaxID=390640 RepID=A0A1H5KTU6_9FLAO|nr:pyridoxamine 5'-phosphate oxidase [Salinimicrobium catena]SDL01689.1 Pyridoxamine 5'-phosphate oxidase [Salinimicrobium catena]SEE68245.1 Pyridoxamine 5'-phosphate oxidase [Salinimicrobium catena]
MKNKLHDYRKLYQKHQLLEDELPSDPFELFHYWIRETETNKEVEEINTMTVSTVGLDGFPKSRVVLLKEYDMEGFVFYTNYLSEKGKSISENPKVCLSFFWPTSERQVIIKGIAQKTSEEEAQEYFQSRPRGSQLGAWASAQSSIIPSREFLKKRLEKLEAEYEGKEVPKPPYWGGYKVIPLEFEYWQGRPNRLHDRIYYSKENDNWKMDRLAP